MPFARALPAAFLLATAVARAQESAPDSRLQQSRPVDRRDLGLENITHDGFYSRIEGDEAIFVVRNPELRAGDWVISAERGVLFLDAEEYVRGIVAAQPTGKELKPGPALPPTAGRELLAEARRRAVSESAIVRGPVLELRDAPFRAALRSIYFDGDVRARNSNKSSVAAGAVLVEVSSGRVLLVDGKLRFDLTANNRPMPLLVRARVVRQEITGVTHCTDTDLTTCEFATPHYHVRSEDVEVRAVAREELFVQASHNRLDLEGPGPSRSPTSRSTRPTSSSFPSKPSRPVTAGAMECSCERNSAATSPISAKGSTRRSGSMGSSRGTGR